MSRILLYTTPFCGYCRTAKRLLAEKTLDFEEIDVAFDRDKRAEMLEREGKLDDWLANPSETPASETPASELPASETLADANET